MEFQCQREEIATGCCESCQKTEEESTDRTDGVTGCADHDGLCRSYAEHYDCETKMMRTTDGNQLLKDVCCNACLDGPDKDHRTDAGSGDGENEGEMNVENLTGDGHHYRGY